MLTAPQAARLKQAGLDYYNHNLDTSPEYYRHVITTRTYQDRLDTLEHAFLNISTPKKFRKIKAWGKRMARPCAAIRCYGTAARRPGSSNACASIVTGD